MKTTSINRMDFTADYWDYTVAQNPDTGAVQRNYEYVGEIRLALFPANAGGMMTVYRRGPVGLRPLALLKNVRDRSGNLVFLTTSAGQPYDMVVSTAEPIFNIFGVIEGWVHDVRRDG